MAEAFELPLPRVLPPIDAEFYADNIAPDALREALAAAPDTCVGPTFGGAATIAPEGGNAPATTEAARTAAATEGLGWNDIDPNDDDGLKLLAASAGIDPATLDFPMNADQRLKWLADNGFAPKVVPGRHAELMRTEIPAAARESLKALGQDVHNPYDRGSGNYNIDEYSVVFDELPDGMGPEEFLNMFLESPNGTADDFRLDGFNFYNVFTLKEAGSQESWKSAGPSDTPDVGDWFHLDIPGNNGDVVIVDKQIEPDRAYATVMTMTDDELMFQDHPVSGRRQFGVEVLPDGGGYRFYTRAVDRQTTPLMDLGVSRVAQDNDWTRLMEAMAATYDGRPEAYGESLPPSERAHVIRQNQWGWAEHIPAETVLDSGVEPPSVYPCGE